MRKYLASISVRASGTKHPAKGGHARAALVAGAALLAWTGCVQQIAGGGGSGGGGAGGGGASAGGGGAGIEPAGEVQLSIVVDQWVSLEGIPTPPPSTSTTACGVLLPVPVPSETVLATSGACSLVTVEVSPPSPWSVALGQVTVAMPSQGAYLLSAPQDLGECSSHGSEDPVLWNDIVTFEGHGEADVPAFLVEVPAPPPLIPHPDGHFQVGGPYEIQFSDDSAGVRVEVSGAGPAKIVCWPSGAEPLVIDGALTAEIEPVNERAVVSVTRASEVTAAAGAVPLRARVVQMDTFSPVVIP